MANSAENPGLNPAEKRSDRIKIDQEVVVAPKNVEGGTDSEGKTIVDYCLGWFKSIITRTTGIDDAVTAEQAQFSFRRGSNLKNDIKIGSLQENQGGVYIDQKITLAPRNIKGGVSFKGDDGKNATIEQNATGINASVTDKQGFGSIRLGSNSENKVKIKW